MRRFAKVLLLLLVCAIGFGVGAWISIERRAVSFAAGVERHLAESAPVAAAMPKLEKRAFPTDEEMLTAIMSAVIEKEPLLRAYRLHEAIGRLGSAELGALFTRVVQMDDYTQREELLQSLLAQWVAIDPAVAAAAVQPYRDRFYLVGHWDARNNDCMVSQIWATVTPQAALDEAMASTNVRWAVVIAQAGLGALTDNDPKRELEALARLPDNRLRTQLGTAAIRALAESDPAAAEAALNLVTDNQQRAALQIEVLGNLAEKDPQAGLERLSTLTPGLASDGAGTRLVYSVLQAAAKKDPIAAMDAVAGLPEELRDLARNGVLAGWASENPADALAWAEANDVSVSDIKVATIRGIDGLSWNSLTGIALGRDREKTLEWIATQPVSSERDMLLHEGLWHGNGTQKLEIYQELTPEGRIREASSLANSLYEEDHERALGWARDLPPGAERAAAVQSVASSQVKGQLDQADAVIEGWSAGPDRDAALRGVANSFAWNQPTSALDYARRIGDSATREAALYYVASTWFNRDPGSARTWLTGTTELPADQKKVLLRLFNER